MSEVIPLGLAREDLHIEDAGGSRELRRGSTGDDLGRDGMEHVAGVNPCQAQSLPTSGGGDSRIQHSGRAALPIATSISEHLVIHGLSVAGVGQADD